MLHDDDVIRYIAHKCKCLNYFKWDYIVNKEEVALELKGIAEQNCGVNDDPVSTIVSDDWSCVFSAEKAVDAEDEVDDLKLGTFCYTEWCTSQASAKHLNPCLEEKFVVKVNGLMPEGQRHKKLLEHEVVSNLNSTGANTNVGKGNRRGISRMYFFFGDLKVVKYTQQKSMSFGAMLGGLAGYLGLFLGISVVTIIEVLELLFVWVFDLNGYRTGRGGEDEGEGGDDRAGSNAVTEV